MEASQTRDDPTSTSPSAAFFNKREDINKAVNFSCARIKTAMKHKLQNRLKHSKLGFSILGFSILALFVILNTSSAADLPASEKAPLLKAGEVVPAQLLSGKNYTIAPEVSMEGYLGNFTLNTEFGPLKVRGTELLQIRISEIPAMEKLNEISKTEVFAKAAANAAASQLKSLKKVEEDPVGTVKGIPSGLGRFFKKVQKTASKGVEAIKDSGTYIFELNRISAVIFYFQLSCLRIDFQF